MDDKDFFSLLHQQWSKTTGAEDMFWMSEEYTDGTGRWKIYAVAIDENNTQCRKLIASDLQNEADADFVAAVHGCLPDLVRRLLMATDEAERLDEERDRQEGRIAELEMEADRFVGAAINRDERIAELEREAQEADRYFQELDQENIRLRAMLEEARADINVWKYRP